MKTYTLSAPAKLNLALDVTGTRTDGYHLLETVFQTISIYDRVTVRLTDTPGIVMHCTQRFVPCNPKNIAWKAAERFCEKAGYSGGIDITLEKHIPTQAGMGGGSTDAAATLLALQKLTNEPLSQQQLAEIAVTLGADVPFFLYGGTAYAAGIGEQLEPLVPFRAKHIVVAKGKKGVSTAEAYRKIDVLENPVHPPVQQLRQAITEKKPLAEIAPLCGNLFESVVSLPEITQIRRTMLEHGALCSVMTGSGAAVFGLFKTQTQAQDAQKQLLGIVPFVTLCETIE